MGINLKKTYFYNNSAVKVLELREDCEFALVVVDNNFHTELNGSDWCQACQIGGTQRHTCEDVDDVIESILDDIAERNIFWVDVKHLQDKPIEFTKWEKLNKENEELQKKISYNKKKLSDLQSISNNINCEINNNSVRRNKQKLELLKLNTEITDSYIKLRDMKNQTRDVTVENLNFSITLSDLKRMIKAELKLESLESNGVDNWEFYGESLPNDEQLELGIIKEIGTYQKT